jgi:DNA repair ATPase RecN
LVIFLRTIEVRGQAEAGEFSGTLELNAGLQIISARNAYGKSLAVKAIAWCLGLEPIFGNADNDPVRLPEAVREEIDLLGYSNNPVLSSECAITFQDDKGRSIEISRAIKGGDLSVVIVREINEDGKERTSKLQARRATMQDEHGGFQRFLFEWLGWPRIPVPTFRLTDAEIYLENLAPLFYIDQNEGWTNPQSLQISRYGQLEISQIAVEYLLGAMDSLNSRVDRLRAGQRAAELKGSAKITAEQLNDEMLRYGWRIEWSSHGSLTEIANRWSKRTLKETLKDDALVDLTSRRKDLGEKISALREALTTRPVDTNTSPAIAETSQKVINLKNRRHELSQDLATFNSQLRETSNLLETIEHRVHSAEDLLRLKTTGVGRLEHLECPTCHRDLEPAIFGLTKQSAESVASHIVALKSDRELIQRNQEALAASVRSSIAEISRVDGELREAEKALTSVNAAVGSFREQIVATAAELSATERESERVREAAKKIDELQKSIDRWIADTRAFIAATEGVVKQPESREAFLANLRKYLVALGHSEVAESNAQTVNLDDEYIPFMNGRRLRALGSGSDPSRLVAAYTLALAAAAQQVGGKHPGIVILDEPLQQNPDDKHRDLFLTFLTKQLAQKPGFQTLIFTWLSDPEIEKLRAEKILVVTPSGEHFLQLKLKPPTQDQAAPNEHLAS